MKILQVHNNYQLAGGEDVVVQQELELLRNHGHEVIQHLKSNHEIGSIGSKVKLLFSTHYNETSKKEMAGILADARPDIVHVHNFFPLFSPSIFDAIKAYGIPSVLTLHNYRLIHPNGLMLHKGAIDERGLSGSVYACVKDKVYRDSYLQTAVVAHMIDFHKKRATWNNKVTRFITLSSFAKSKFVEWGLNPELIGVKPNFIEDHLGHPPMASDKRQDYVYIGRISDEKGIDKLIEYWHQNESRKLHIVGEGPLLNELKGKTNNNTNLVWYGRLSREQSIERLRQSRALIFPSICYENFPMTILEAFGNGVPVISNNIGSHATIINDGQNGLLFDITDPESLKKALDQTASDQHNQQLSDNAYRSFLNEYNAESNYEMLMSIYGEAISSSTDGIE